MTTKESNSADQLDNDAVESKIDFQHRAVREGFEKKAAAYRLKQRKKFQSQGKTKAESGKLAWAATIERYPPIEKMVALWFVIGQYPPEDCKPPEPGQPDLPACWYVFHSIRAASIFVERWQRTKNPDDWIRGATTMLRHKDESPTPSARALF